MDNILSGTKLKQHVQGTSTTGSEKSEKGFSDKLSENDMENVVDFKDAKLGSKERIYYNIISKYYKSLNQVKVKIMIDIIEGNSIISLRLLDWFITKYSNVHTVRYCLKFFLNDDILNSTYKIDKNKNLEEINKQDIDSLFNVHISYKAQLKSYKKRYFDPFRRNKKKKFRYYFDGEKKISLVTTIGQLNFFRWLFVNGIIHYVIFNYKKLHKDMVNNNKTIKKDKIGKLSSKSDDSKTKSDTKTMDSRGPVDHKLSFE